MNAGRGGGTRGARQYQGIYFLIPDRTHTDRVQQVLAYNNNLRVLRGCRLRNAITIVIYIIITF